MRKNNPAQPARKSTPPQIAPQTMPAFCADSVTMFCRCLSSSRWRSCSRCFSSSSSGSMPPILGTAGERPNFGVRAAGGVGRDGGGEPGERGGGGAGRVPEAAVFERGGGAGRRANGGGGGGVAGGVLGASTASGVSTTVSVAAATGAGAEAAAGSSSTNCKPSFH